MTFGPRGMIKARDRVNSRRSVWLVVGSRRRRSSPCYPIDREPFQRYKLARAGTLAGDCTRLLPFAHSAMIKR